jgi:hypothetical protein
MISFCTRGIAVAVNATIGMDDSMEWDRISSPSERKSGRKSWLYI